jgi:hypothetical protein
MADTFRKIAEISLAAGTSSASFTSIPATYTDLQLYISARSARTGTTEDQLVLQVNNDSGSNYKRTTLYNDYSAIYANGDSTGYQTAYSTSLGSITAANALTSSYGKMWVYFSDYANTSKFKQIHLQGTSQTNSDVANQGYFYFLAGEWTSTSAINSIKIVIATGNNFAAGSTATLYGILKG